jgi:hypothetical protein
VTFHSEHRLLQAYSDARANAGFLIERDPRSGDPSPAGKWHRIPLFLHICAPIREAHVKRSLTTTRKCTDATRRRADGLVGGSPVPVPAPGSWLASPGGQLCHRC